MKFGEKCLDTIVLFDIGEPWALERVNTSYLKAKKQSNMPWPETSRKKGRTPKVVATFKVATKSGRYFQSSDHSKFGEKCLGIFRYWATLGPGPL